LQRDATITQPCTQRNNHTTLQRNNPATLRRNNHATLQHTNMQSRNIATQQSGKKKCQNFKFYISKLKKIKFEIKFEIKNIKKF
jgi:hypothetical protein